ncbi:ERVV2 protein, partial [Xiphorhynchus elegans]|nr:ERVV2 protein [Xiphorhynchus elegans]
ELEKAIINISAVIEHLENRTMNAVKALKKELHGLSRIMMENRVALDFVLASQGGVCK